MDWDGSQGIMGAPACLAMPEWYKTRQNLVPFWYMLTSLKKKLDLFVVSCYNLRWVLKLSVCNLKFTLVYFKVVLFAR